jgi:hypothetical protein
MPKLPAKASEANLIMAILLKKLNDHISCNASRGAGMT